MAYGLFYSGLHVQHMIHNIEDHMSQIYLRAQVASLEGLMRQLPGGRDDEPEGALCRLDPGSELLLQGRHDHRKAEPQAIESDMRLRCYYNRHYGYIHIYISLILTLYAIGSNYRLLCAI